MMTTNTKWTEKGGRLPGMKERGCCLQWILAAAAAAGNPGDFLPNVVVVQWGAAVPVDDSSPPKSVLFFFLLCFYSSSFSLSLLFSFVLFTLSLFSVSVSLFPLSFFPPLFSPVSFSLSLYPLCSSFDFSSQSPFVWVSLFLRYPVNSPLFYWFPPLSVSVSIVFSPPPLFCSIFSSLSHLPPPFSFSFPLLLVSVFKTNPPLFFHSLGMRLPPPCIWFSPCIYRRQGRVAWAWLYAATPGHGFPVFSIWQGYGLCQ